MKLSAAHGIVNQVLVYTMVGIGLSASAGVGAVWMRQQISQTANANKALEAQITDLTRRSEEAAAAIAEEQDTSVLLQKNLSMGIGLLPPREDQVQRVTEDPVVRLASKRNSGLFADTGGASLVSIRLAAQP
jgi:hypothetical protein